MSKPKLTYFNAPGRAEASRLALYIAGIEFDDERYININKKQNCDSH